MPRLHFALICQTILTDQLSNSVSYIQALEEISVSDFPFHVPAIMLGALWERDDENDEITFRVRILAPSNEQIGSIKEQTASFRKHKRIRQNTVLNGMPLTMEGRYEFLLETRNKENWEERCRIPLDVSRLVTEQLNKLQDDRIRAATKV